MNNKAIKLGDYVVRINSIVHAHYDKVLNKTIVRVTRELSPFRRSERSTINIELEGDNRDFIMQAMELIEEFKGF